MNGKDKKAIAAAKVLKKYCRSFGNCEGCIFYTGQYTPTACEFDISLPEELNIKELKQRAKNGIQE